MFLNAGSVISTDVINGQVDFPVSTVFWYANMNIVLKFLC